MFFRATDKRAAEEKYRRYRADVYAELSRPGESSRKIRLEPITAAALKTFKEVWLLHDRRVDWNWPEEVEIWRRKCPSRLEMSVWHENHLCGLLIARTSSNRKKLYIEGIEGAPYHHPLKGSVIPICISAAETYAGMIDAMEVRVRDPDPAVESSYIELGYTVESVALLRSEPYAYKLMGETT